MDDSTPFQMPPLQGRNILIFSDGTGQAGGYLFDEARSNVYKLFRATRCGPDSNIDPGKQLTFYDPGLGSKGGGATIRFSWLRRIYNALSGATGLGITRNIIDCYAALIMLWRPGDRIFLFGFSRGAYTVRCLAGVLGLCDIPRQMPEGTELRRSPANVEAIAAEAVKRVYRHGSGAGDLLHKAGAAAPSQPVGQQPGTSTQDKLRKRMERLRLQRVALGKQFRIKYGSDGPHESNAIPHFIGVWDTVAAVGLSPPAFKTAVFGIILGALLLAGSIARWQEVSFAGDGAGWFIGVLVGVVTIATVIYYGLRLKWVTGLPGYHWYQTVHLTSLQMKFFDRSLNPFVRYARHALALDEFRADFDRVEWIDEAMAPNRELAEGAWFEQLWFAGDHSDVGGSYPENEARLSDLSLGWVAGEAKRAGMLVDESLLQLYGRHDGAQHDECQVGVLFCGMRFPWRRKLRKISPNAPVHWSVRERLQGGDVLIYDTEKRYRPPLLERHHEFGALYPQGAPPAA